MLFKHATIHDGLGKVFVGDLLVEDGVIKAVAPELPGEGEDFTGKHILPGLIDTHSFWGINGSSTEIKPSSNDNDELSDPITPELDVVYAFNGRAMSVQQLPAYGITAAGVAPRSSNVFGGTVGAFVTKGVNPFAMCLKERAAMKASVSKETKKAYGAKRSVAPFTRMRIYQMFASTLRKASEYDPAKEGVERNDKYAALKPVLSGEMPLFIECDNAEERALVMRELKPYEQVQVVFTSISCMDELDLQLDPARVSFIDGFAGLDCDPRCLNKRYDILEKLMAKGMKVGLATMHNGHGREWMIWGAAELTKQTRDPEGAIAAMTSVPAKILSIDGMTGSIEAGKRADLAVWSAHPLEDFRAKVLATYIAGECAYQEGDEIKCYI